MNIKNNRLTRNVDQPGNWVTGCPDYFPLASRGGGLEGILNIFKKTKNNSNQKSIYCKNLFEIAETGNSFAKGDDLDTYMELKNDSKITKSIIQGVKKLENFTIKTLKQHKDQMNIIFIGVIYLHKT